MSSHKCLSAAKASNESKRALIALFVVFLLLGAGIAFAYLSAHDHVSNHFTLLGEDKDVTVEWREVPPTVDVDHEGYLLIKRIAWNNTTAEYVEGSTTSTLNAYSVGNEGSYDSPDPYVFLADTKTEEEYQALLIGAEVTVTNSVVPVPTGKLFYIEKDRGSTEHPTKNGVTYSKYRMTVKPYTTTIIKESQLKKLLSVQPVEPQWNGYVHNGWTTPVKVGTDPDTGNDKYVVKSTWVKRSNPDVTEDSSYAAVYGDDTLVFGRGAAPGSYEGKPLSSQNGVACTWYDIEDAVYSRVELPWRDTKPNIKSVVVKDTIAPKSIAFWFETMGNLASVDLSKLDASKVEDAQSLFGNDALISTIDLSMLDMPKVKNISNMFYGCKGATSLKIPGGFTNELKEMGQVFYDCISVKTLDLEGLDVSGVTNMSRLFWNCPTLTTVFVNENWNINHIRDGIAEGIYDDHGQMFSGCSNLIGGNGTKCESRLGEVTRKASIQYAYIDSHSHVGYLTCRTAKAGSVTISSDADTPNIFSASLNPAYEGVSLAYQWYRNGQAIAGATARTFQPTEADKDCMITCKVVVNDAFVLTSNELKFDGFVFAVYSADDRSLNLYKRFDMPSVGSSYNGKTVTNIYIGFENTSAPDWRSIRENIKTVTVVDKGITPQKGIDDWFSRFSSCTEMNLANLDVSKVTSLFRVFGFEYSLVTLDVSGWDTSNVTNMSEMFYFSYSEDGDKLTTIKGIESWDTSNVTNMSGMFEPCQGLTCLNLSSWDTSKVTNMARMFSFCSSLTSLDVSTWDTSSVTSMRDMFYYCPKLTSLDISGWDTSKVTNMGYMFANCSALTSLDVSTWDTSQVNNMSCMFSSCNALTSLDVSSWDTSKVINMNSMFYNCASLKTIYSSPSADWSKVSSSENMFFYYEGTPSKRLTIVGGKGTKYDTTKTDASYARVDGLNGKPGYFTAKTPKAMIAGTITVSGTTQAGNVLTANVSGTQQPSGLAYKWYRDDTLISGAASKTYLLTAKDIGHTISCKVTNKNYRGYLKSLAVGPVSNPAMTGSVSISGTAESGSLLTASVANAPIGAVVSYQWLRDGSPIDGATGSTYTLVEADIDHTITCVVTASGFSGSLTSNEIGPIAKPEPKAFAVYSADDNSLNFYKRSNVPSAGETFEGKAATEVYTGFEEQAARPWSGQAANVTSVTFVDEGISPVSTASWFSGFSNCTAMNVVKLDMSKTTTASQMFYNCSKLTSLDLSSFSTANMTNMSYMFCECAKLDSLNISDSFSTENVTNTSYMFSRCKALTSIDVSGFNTAKVTNAKYMFSECQSLTSLDVSNWNTAAIKQFESMFNGCSALNSLDVSGFITSSATTLRSMFSGCSALTSLDVSGFNTAKVTNMSGMFTGCKSLTSLDVSGFNTARVTNMSYMFSACSALVTIYAGETWSTGAVATSTSMFLNCTALSGGRGTIYVPTKVDAKYAHIDGGEANPGYFTAKPDSALEGSVTIGGEAFVGSTLTASAALTSAGAEPSYQWCRDETAIDGATSSTYMLAEADIDHTITCVVTASGFSGSLVSNGVGPVTKPKTEVEKQLESMTLHEKVCQMFTVYPEDLGGSGALTVAGSTQQKTLQNYPYGGVCYFLQNIKNETQAKTLVSTLESYSEIPLFHAVDEEGGRVQRIGGTIYSGAVRGAGIGNQLNAMYTYKDQGADTAYNNAQLLAANLNRLGMNWDFAPCADVNSNPSNPVIGDRAYGDDFDATGELVASAVRGFNDAGVATALKHFPGHGDTATDSHTGAAAVSKTLEQLRTEEFKSFKAGIAAGADSVMMGHLMIDGAKESVPTSCSYEFVTEVLRNELGFDGVITTDGMGMGALTKVFGTTKQGHIDAVMACLKAGIDVFLLPGDPAACVDAIEAAVASGEISEDRIDASVKRILTLKEKIAANKSKRNAATLQAMHAAAVADEELTAAATQSSAVETKVAIEVDTQSAAVGDTLSLRANTEGVDETDHVTYRWYISSKADMTDKTLVENATQGQIEYLLEDPGTWYFQCEVVHGEQSFLSEPIAIEASTPEGRQ